MSRSTSFFASLLFLVTVGCGSSQTSSVGQPVVVDPAAAAGTQVGIVISPDDATVSTYFISESNDPVVALKALQDSGASLVTDTTGLQLCSINGVGHPQVPCLGTGSDPFWGFFVRNVEGGWTFSDVGVASYFVKDGDVLGFAWTGIDFNTFQPLRTPPSFTLTEIAAR
ncbi:MAG: hypothetical protein V1798_07030 [Pseudomonadota bacterium]